MTDFAKQIKNPAIGLLIIGIFNAATSFLVLVSGLFRLVAGIEQLPASEAERTGYIIGTVFGYGVAFIGLLISPIIIYGAIQMMSFKKLGLAKMASVLAFIPLISCCFVIGMPVGIWSFMILRKPEVKDYFNGKRPEQSFSPPQPPTF